MWHEGNRDEEEKEGEDGDVVDMISCMAVLIDAVKRDGWLCFLFADGVADREPSVL